MLPETFHSIVEPAAAKLFPTRFSSPEASAMILAIGLQESGFMHRRQLIGANRNWWQSLRGPATGFFQFETIGIRGVLEHHTTGPLARSVLQMFGYPTDDVATIHRALVHNDILATAFARLALFRLPDRLPSSVEHHKGWEQYIEAWRPGKPHPERWGENFNRAWSIVSFSQMNH
jgi:hypothetical protein